MIIKYKERCKNLVGRAKPGEGSSPVGVIEVRVGSSGGYDWQTYLGNYQVTLFIAFI